VDRFPEKGVIFVYRDSTLLDVTRRAASQHHATIKRPLVRAASFTARRVTERCDVECCPAWCCVMERDAAEVDYHTASKARVIASWSQARSFHKRHFRKFLVCKSASTGLKK